MTIEELEARQAEIRERLQEIDSEHANQALPEDTRAEWNRLNEEKDSNDDLLSELRARRERVQELGERESESNRESGAAFHVNRGARGDDIWDLSTVRASVSNPQEATRELSDRAKRAIEQADFPHERANRERCQEHVERLLARVDTEDGVLARHILRTGSPSYQRAFGKAISGGVLDQGELRALSTAGSSGGYAVPFTLDPTVVPTSNGSVNPYRAIARVESIVTTSWQGVSSSGVSAAYAAEVTEASDNAPTLSQPEITPERAQAFVPFSVEIGQDWSGLQAEVATMLQDAKDDLEATKFTSGSGSGSDEPEGILTGATTTVDTAAANTFAVADVYSVEEALGARFRPRAQWLGNRAIYNLVRQFDSSGGADLWLRLPQGLANQVPTPGNTGAELIGYPANEVSAMDSTVSAGNDILVFGDFRYFVIVDRIGMTVELVPHLMGGNQRPTGQRGIYAYWRNSSEVLAAAAFRVLNVQSS